MAVRIQAEDFDAGEEAKKLTRGRADIGAVVTFTGLVRGASAQGAIASITLEHHPEMTQAEIERIEAAARARFALADCLIIHRIGELSPGDNVVLVIAAAAHRRQAFEAAEYLMDYLKTQAPFWKKETDREGNSCWVEAREADSEAAQRWQNAPIKAAE